MALQVFASIFLCSSRFPANAFNAVLFDGEQVISPDELEDVDTEEYSVLEHREYTESISCLVLNKGFPCRLTAGKQTEDIPVGHDKGIGFLPFVVYPALLRLLFKKHKDTPHCFQTKPWNYPCTYGIIQITPTKFWGNDYRIYKPSRFEKPP